MSHRSSAYRTAGFTLAELLVVVAIVAVLVAVAIPVFTGALGSTEEATCDANRRSVKSMYTTAWLLDQNRDSQQTLFDTCVAQLKKQNNDVLCPSGGNYTATFTSNGAAIVKCSKHGLGLDDELGGWLATYDGPYTGDESARKAYAADKGLTSWPSVKGLDKETYYLQFKSYNNSAENAFLYAGPTSTIENSNSWRAKYLCDNNGLYGTPGQWYELPKVEGISMYGNGAEEKLIKLLETGTQVTLEGDKFVKSA